MMRTAALRPVDIVPAALAGVMAIVAIGFGWRGADWPAQLLRVELVERDWPSLWNNLWFAGHHTPTYSVLFPTLAVAVGPAVVAVVSCAVAAGCFHLLVRGVASPRQPMTASALFATGTVVNVAIGRLTFALGLAVALAALAALRAERRRLATVLIVAAAPASPVAGVILGLALMAWALHTHRIVLVALAGLAVAPVGVFAVVFPQDGRFPFRVGALALSLVVVVFVASVTEARIVRFGSAIYAIACVATFVAPNPLGANLTRFGMFFAAPVLVLTARRLPTPLVALAIAVTTWWQWSPAIDGIARAGRDLSSVVGYHEPLIDAIRSAGPMNGRLEVVPTQRHWETVHVAAEIPLARGWERQLDMARNPIFYRSELDIDGYHEWLREHAVQYVALADVPLDPSGEREAAIVRRPVSFLELVWHDDHWQLWRVVDAEPLVAAPARLVGLQPSAVVLDITTDQSVLVRVRYSSHWSLDRPGCVWPSPDGWTVVQAREPGIVRLRTVLARSLPIIGSLDGCPE